MATATDLRVFDLQKLGRTLRIARLERASVYQGAAGFETGASLMGFLRGLRVRLRDRYPKLDRYSRFGPGYACEDGGDDERYHSFKVGWDITRANRFVSFSIDFPVSSADKPEWFVLYKSGRAAEAEVHCGDIKEICTRGVLDADKFFVQISRRFERWKVV